MTTGIIIIDLSKITTICNKSAMKQRLKQSTRAAESCDLQCERPHEQSCSQRTCNHK